VIHHSAYYVEAGVLLPQKDAKKLEACNLDKKAQELLKIMRVDYPVFGDKKT
jgi:hypothetical protein